MNDKIDRNDFSSFENVGHLEVLVLNLNPLDKPCVGTAEDIAQATSHIEVEKLTNLTVGEAIISTMLENELKLNKAFSIPLPPSSKISSPRCIFEAPVTTNQKTPLFLHEVGDMSQSIQNINVESDFVELIGLSNPEKCTIKMLHPIQSSVDFNSAMFEIAHLACSTQNAFNISHKTVVVPVPYRSFIMNQSKPRNLYYIQTKSQQDDIDELSKNVELFYHYIIDIAEEVSKALSVCLPPIHSEKKIFELIPETNIKPNDKKWNAASDEMITLAQFFANALRIYGLSSIK